MLRRIDNWLVSLGERRSPDVIIGEVANPYLLRWHLLPRNPVFNVYLHQFRRSDDDRALHDHPWFNVSRLLRGSYVEHTIAAGGIHRRRVRRAGAWALRSPWRAHRIELPNRRLVTLEADGKRRWRQVPMPCWTLFITGPRLREWGFHCADTGWIHWRTFTDPATGGKTVGKGCAP
jgi:hypothetical protein